ncbi:hypothetical protein BHE74_00059423 [Ensete ventricosum]|nr:hypothetical protein GW17_00044196 [Ensete ventricosum]RWW35628.1 hypothetical protein BHE74_00059423 [Ensete ventricosum]RZR78100.1 hypothetical protein BHM03_00003347 [Ensete ventricosum]
MAKHGRTYANESEKSYRLGVFTRNLDYVNAFRQAGKHSYTLGLNGFADLTNEEFLATYTMTIRLSPSDGFYPGSKPFRYANAIAPSSIDRRDKGAVTRVKKHRKRGKGSSSSCSSSIPIHLIIRGPYRLWSTPFVSVHGTGRRLLGILCSSIDRRHQQDRDGEPDIFDDNDDGCSGGLHYRASSYAIDNGGITTEENYPYQPDQVASDDTKESDYDATITGYEIVPTKDEKSLMNAVANQPVSVAIDSHEIQFYSGGIYDGPCGTNLNHEVTLVGYDTDEDGTAFWIAKNSWGTAWGESGYILLAKDVAETEGRCGLAIRASYPVI